MIDMAIILTILSPYLTIIPALGVLYFVCIKKVPVYSNPLNTGLLLLFIWALVSGIANMSLFSAATSLVLLFYFFIAAYLQHVFTDKDAIYAFFRKVYKYSLFPALLGIVEKLASYFFDLSWIAAFYLDEPTKYVYRIYTTFGNPNVAGSWFAVMIVLTLYFFERDDYQHKLYYIFYLTTFAIALVFTGSRGATMALEAAILLYALLSRSRLSRTVMLSTFFMIIILALSSPEINFDHPMNSRVRIWMESLKIFVKKPLLGWGVFGILKETNWIHSHNIWISLMTMFGTVGLAIYLWIKTCIYRNIILLYRHNPHTAALLAAIQVLMVVHGVVDSIMLTPQGGLMFIASCAITISLTRRYEPYPQLELAQGWARLKSNFTSGMNA
ncbi:MAG TPA: O-antigen ligase family protein [Candidatus Atribacteria bacterium]|nr:O-antigen ligase family protein [Candidatus Atribacteria bacterium]